MSLWNNTHAEQFPCVLILCRSWKIHQKKFTHTNISLQIHGRRGIQHTGILSRNAASSSSGSSFERRQLEYFYLLNISTCIMSVDALTHKSVSNDRCSFHWWAMRRRALNALLHHRSHTTSVWSNDDMRTHHACGRVNWVPFVRNIWCTCHSPVNRPRRIHATTTSLIIIKA